MVIQLCVINLVIYISIISKIILQTNITEYLRVSYGKCSKILSNSFLGKRPMQTVQTQIRLHLKKQSDQGLPCLLF